MLLQFFLDVFTAADGGLCKSTECAFSVCEFMGTDDGLAAPLPGQCRFLLSISALTWADPTQSDRATPLVPLCSS